MMKKFLFRVILFSILFFFSLVIYWLIRGEKQLPDNNALHQKISYVTAKQEINTVFVGSSKVNNQINPLIIDSLNHGVKSFNLGVNGSFGLENLYTIRYLLDNKPSNLKTIVLEIQTKQKFTRTNLNSSRSYSVLSPKNFVFSLMYHLEERDYRQVGYTIYSSLFNIFSLGRNSFTKITSEEMNDFDTNKGFLALDFDLNPEVKERNKRLSKDPEEIERRIKAFENDRVKYQVNDVYLQEIYKLNEDCLKNNIQLILFFPAPAEPDAQKLVSFEKVVNLPVINILSSKSYPELYTLNVRWDYGHLNNKGATKLSGIVGKQLNNIINTEKEEK